MSIDEHLRRVKLAESDAEAARGRAREALDRLRQDAKAAATPWRIVGVGAVVGFMAGRAGGGAEGAPGVGGRLFASVTQLLVSSLSASVTAGIADAAADAAAEAEAEAGAAAGPAEPAETP